MPAWLLSVLTLLRDITRDLLMMALGQERSKRQAAEAQLQEEYREEAIDERNKSYRDRGKRGLLERLHKHQARALDE